ncbi:hypothetical protein GQ53DRAFT_406212 [Thozetella sp. PMI_491]|nr:hypothetical protein GQ53DRAFT_406212 [Thozetella sp. PMI_491]
MQNDKRPPLSGLFASIATLRRDLNRGARPTRAYSACGAHNTVLSLVPQLLLFFTTTSLRFPLGFQPARSWDHQAAQSAAPVSKIITPLVDCPLAGLGALALLQEDNAKDSYRVTMDTSMQVIWRGAPVAAGNQPQVPRAIEIMVQASSLIGHRGGECDNWAATESRQWLIPARHSRLMMISAAWSAGETVAPPLSPLRPPWGGGRGNACDVHEDHLHGQLSKLGLHLGVPPDRPCAPMWASSSGERRGVRPRYALQPKVERKESEERGGRGQLRG